MYPCVCCGHLTIPEQPGSYFICPICFWEDDVSQLRWPTMSGGANDVSLIEGQANFREFGSCKLRMNSCPSATRNSKCVAKGRICGLLTSAHRYSQATPSPSLSRPDLYPCCPASSGAAPALRAAAQFS